MFKINYKAFVLLIALVFCNCLFKTRRDLTISFNGNTPYFILNDDRFPYKGAKIDSLYRHLWEMSERSYEHLKKTGNDKNYYKFMA